MFADFYREVRSHGIIGGFGLTVDKTHLVVGKGLAYDAGEQALGEGALDFAGLGEGWWSVALTPAGIVAAKGVLGDGLLLCVCLTDAHGEVQIVRDVRRMCWPFVWESGEGACLHMDIPMPFRLLRVQAAVREPCGNRAQLVWTCSQVTLPTYLGAVLRGPVWWPLKLDKACHLGAGLVVEGYML